MADWTLTINGRANTLAGWGLMDCSLNLRSFDADVFAASSAIFDASSTPLMPEGASVALTSPDGVCRFRGKSRNPALDLDGGVWRWHYTCENVWAELNETVLQQVWTRLDFSTTTEVSADGAEIIFGAWYDSYQDENGETQKTVLSVTTETMIRNVVTYAAESCGVALTLASTPPAIYTPSWTAKDISCAQALKAICKWHPAAYTYFDYTTGVPSLNIQVSGGNQQYIAGSDPRLENVSLKPRHDLVIEGVVLRYLCTRTLTESKIEWQTDNYKWTLNPGSKTVLATREADYEYVIEFSAGLGPKNPGTLIYSCSWPSQLSSPPDAALAILSESQGLQNEGSVTLLDDACPIFAVGSVLNLSGLPITGGANTVTGVLLSIDACQTTLSIGPRGALGKDWIDLLARRMPSSATDGKSPTSAVVPGSATPTPEALDEEQEQTLEDAGALVDDSKNYEDLKVTMSSVNGPISRWVKVRKVG